MSLTPNRPRQTTLTNLSLCYPELSEPEKRRLCRQSLQETACAALEMGKAWLLPVERTLAYVTETEGLDEWQKALKSDQPVLILAPHAGNWEIFGIWVSQNTATTFLYQPPRQEALHALLIKTRSRGNIKLAPTNRKGVMMLSRAMQRKELVGVLPDQVPGNDGGIHASFFGQPALTMTLVSRLIQDKSVQVFCGFAKRLPRGRGFKAYVYPVDEKLYSPDLQTSVTALNKSVQQIVEIARDQYQWEYKRFRHLPAGKRVYD